MLEPYQDIAVHAWGRLPYIDGVVVALFAEEFEKILAASPFSQITGNLARVDSCHVGIPWL